MNFYNFFNRINKMSFDFLTKIILIGDCGVGKTSIARTFVNDNFGEDYKSTLAIDFFSKTFEKNSKIIKQQIWDTAGQERFNGITKNYLRNIHGGFLVFDVSNRDSFNNIRKWYEMINKKNIFYLIGNKIDSENREVSKEEGKKLADELNIPYYEVSSLTKYNLDEIFTELGNDIVISGILNNKSYGKIKLIEENKNKKCC